ncbi:helix-turn-helix domain-containing protein [Candidatus Hydrogenedentota bacterium]
MSKTKIPEKAECLQISQEVMPEIMTVSQVAKYLQLNPQVVYRHVKKGTIPVSKIGKTLRFRKATIDKWLDTLSDDSLKRATGLVEARPAAIVGMDLTVD